MRASGIHSPVANTSASARAAGSRFAGRKTTAIRVSVPKTGQDMATGSPDPFLARGAAVWLLLTDHRQPTCPSGGASGAGTPGERAEHAAPARRDPLSANAHGIRAVAH